MANEIEASKIKIRRDTTENWNDINPKLDEGEIGIEWVDTNTGVCKIKIGNGSLNWLDLPYFAGNNIPYSNITTASLPTINGIPVKGNLSLTSLGIQPLGNYATNSEVDEKLNDKANVDDVYSREYLDEKFLEYSSSQVPSTYNQQEKYLKVVEDDNQFKMVWSDITGDIVTTEALSTKLEDYVEKSDFDDLLVNTSEYESLKADVDTIKRHNLDDMESDIEDIAEELNNKVNKSELGTYIDEEKLAQVLTGTEDTPYSSLGYVSKEEFVEKANLADLTDHTTDTSNPHQVTKEQIGLGNVENYSPEDMPISNAVQEALDNKRDNFEIGSGLGLANGYLYNTAPNQNTDWDNIINRPLNGDFQADWNETNANKLSYIKNKPTIQYYELPVAKKEVLGGIKLGEDFTVDEEGHLKNSLEIDDYTNLKNKPSFLVAKRDEETGEIIPGEYYDYPLVKGMIPSDYNLASLTVAKAIDQRLEEEKADKVDLEELRAYVESAIPTAGTVYTKTECDDKFVNKDDYLADMDLKADKANVYSKSETYSKEGIDNKFHIVNNRLTELDNKEDLINKTQTIHGLISDELFTKYTSAGAVKEITDELQADYNTKIEAETARATAAENAISNDLHTNYYTKPEVDTLVSSVYRFKGTVENYSQLPSENNVEGDVWNIINADVSHGIKAGDNVAWVAAKDGVEAHWDVLAGITDLSNYYTKPETDDKFVYQTDFDDEVETIEDNIDGIFRAIVAPANFMGSVDTYEDLPTEDVDVNDLYIVNDTNDYYVWDGEHWNRQVPLSGKADKATTLAGYGINDAYTKVDTNVLINNAVNNKAEQVEVDAVTAPMVYRGIVETFDELPASDNELYDLYVINSTREYYAWDGEQWVRQKSLNEKADKVDTYTKTDINNNFATITLVNTKANQADFSAHINNYNNPHQVTKAQVGLGNCDNTSDLNKPISNATQLALNGKQNNLTSAQLDAVNSGVTAEKVEAYDNIASNYDNLATKTELNTVKTLAETNAATLLTKADADNVYTKAQIDGKLSASMHFKGTVATVAALPSSGQEIGDMYNVAETGSNYAWDGNQWDKLSETIDLSVYYTKSEIDGKVSQINTTISSVDSNLQGQINTKQNNLTPGLGITIENNVISCDIDGTLKTKLSDLENDVGYITLSEVPAINNGILTIQKNGTDVGTFTANSSTDNSINIIVPTSVNDLTDGADYVKETDLGTVALSNDYNDLANKPTIGNATLTIMKNGLSIGTFNANSTNDNTIDIIVPTTVASLSDGEDYALKTDIQTYTAGNGISIDANNVISNTRVSAEWGNIQGNMADQADLQDALDKLETLINEKQGNLEAGDNITIENGVISAEKTKITFKDWTK